MNSEKKDDTILLRLFIDSDTNLDIKTTRTSLSEQFHYFNSMLFNDAFKESTLDIIELKQDFNLRKENTKHIVSFFLDKTNLPFNSQDLYDIYILNEYLQEDNVFVSISNRLDTLLYLLDYSDESKYEDFVKNFSYQYIMYHSIKKDTKNLLESISKYPFYYKLIKIECEEIFEKDVYMKFLFDWNLYAKQNEDYYNDCLINPFDYQNTILESPKEITLHSPKKYLETEQISCNEKDFNEKIPNLFKKDNFPWFFDKERKSEGIIIAGGSIINILSDVKLYKEYNNKKYDWDLFIYGSDKDKLTQFTLKVFDYIYNELVKEEGECFIYPETSLVTLYTKNYMIQIINTNCIHPYEIVRNFDIDYVKCFYQDNKTFVTIDCYKSLLYRTCFEFQFNVNISRIWKALNKGFNLTIDTNILLTKIKYLLNIDYTLFTKDENNINSLLEEYITCFEKKDGEKFITLLQNTPLLLNRINKYDNIDPKNYKDYNTIIENYTFKCFETKENYKIKTINENYIKDETDILKEVNIINLKTKDDLIPLDTFEIKTISIQHNWNYVFYKFEKNRILYEIKLENVKLKHFNREHMSVQLDTIRHKDIIQLLNLLDSSQLQDNAMILYNLIKPWSPMNITTIFYFMNFKLQKVLNKIQLEKVKYQLKNRNLDKNTTSVSLSFYLTYLVNHIPIMGNIYSRNAIVKDIILLN